MTRPIDLIGYACGLGAKKQQCAQGPGKLLYQQLHHALHDHGLAAQWHPLFHIHDEHLKPRTQSLNSYISHLQDDVKKTIQAGHFPITIGGDHTLALGTWPTIIRHHESYQRFGLIWIDAHMDAHTVHTSHTGAYHGMPVSYLLGYGDDDMSQVLPNKPLISSKHLVIIGARSYEKEEKTFLDRLGITVFYMEDILTQGIDAVMKQAIEQVTSGTDAFGVSVDLDAFDPSIAPGVGSPEAGGLDKEATLKALTQLSNQPNLAALEIAEFNPSLDKNNQTADLVKEIILAVCNF